MRTILKLILLVFTVTIFISCTSNSLNKEASVKKTENKCNKNYLQNDLYQKCLENKVQKEIKIEYLRELASIYTLNKEYSKAILMYEIAANKNSFSSMYDLGFIYKDIYKDNILALKWFEKAAFNSYKNATCISGKLYEQEDKQKELDYLNKEVKRGNIKAYTCIALKFLEVNKYEEAKKRFLKASKKGDFEVNYYLSYIHIRYLNDEIKAKEYYSKLIFNKKNISMKCLNYQEIVYLKHKEHCFEYLTKKI